MDADDDLELAAQEAFELSDHGIQRARQRLGIPKRAVEREIERALTRGTPRTELAGRIRRMLDYVWHRHGHYGDYRVWRGHVFVFKNQTFVTVFALTNGLHNTKAGGRDGAR